MTEKTLEPEELMTLYTEPPNLAIYKHDISFPENQLHLKQIAELRKDQSLNPLDVVLESLINVLSEKLSIDTLTESKNMVYVDRSIQEQAAVEIVKLMNYDEFFLKKVHRRWMDELRSFALILREKGINTLQEAIFEISLKFRISASSSLKALASLMRVH